MCVDMCVAMCAEMCLDTCVDVAARGYSSCAAWPDRPYAWGRWAGGQHTCRHTGGKGPHLSLICNHTRRHTCLYAYTCTQSVDVAIHLHTCVYTCVTIRLHCAERTHAWMSAAQEKSTPFRESVATNSDGPTRRLSVTPFCHIVMA